MSALLLVGHLVALLVLPIYLLGVINRTKALWAGRKGPPLAQGFFELRRLVGKQPVYSEVSTVVFRLGPPVVLATALLSGLLAPLLGGYTPVSFPHDFVLLAYLWGLGRAFSILSALDTGSSFEGMGAARDATLGALVEPALFLALGTLAIASGRTSFAELLTVNHGAMDSVIRAGTIVALVIVLQVEAGRVPVDDPSTHLELTMVHEVMILDHSGPDLAALQHAAALRATLCAAMIATLMNPMPAVGPGLAALTNIGLILGVGVIVGSIESLIARLRIKAIPSYILVAIIAGSIALLTTAWMQEGAP